MKNPVFIFITKSFWFGLLPAALFIADVLIQLGTSSVTGPLAGLIAELTGWRAGGVENVLRGVAAATAFVVGYQRRGAAQPYTLDPSATK